MNARKLLSSILLVATAPLLGSVVFLSLAESVVVFESRESTTEAGDPVYNRIEYTSEGDTDVWRMRQSHYGPYALPGKWDEIRIFVSKKQRPFVVRYQQLNAGMEIELKAACITCHANGPRSIRPNYRSLVVKHSVRDKLMVTWMNLRMKTYGRVVTAPESFLIRGKTRQVPLKYFGTSDNSPLKVRSCTICHNQDTFWGRGELLRQQGGTIKHLVKTKQMPPWPFGISAEEAAQIDHFVKGF